MPLAWIGRAPAAPDLLAERRCHDDPALSALTRRVVAALRGRAPSAHGEALCLQLALHLLRAHTGRTVRRPRGRPGAATARRVAERIAADPVGELAVAALARAAGLSDAHFARLFRDTFGQPPHRHILHRRVERAAALVREGRMGLPETAPTAGFCDQAHLTRAFRAVTGRTPGVARGAGWRAVVTLTLAAFTPKAMRCDPAAASARPGRRGGPRAPSSVRPRSPASPIPPSGLRRR